MGPVKVRSERKKHESHAQGNPYGELVYSSVPDAIDRIDMVLGN